MSGDSEPKLTPITMQADVDFDAEANTHVRAQLPRRWRVLKQSVPHNVAQAEVSVLHAKGTLCNSMGKMPSNCAMDQVNIPHAAEQDVRSDVCMTDNEFGANDSQQEALDAAYADLLDMDSSRWRDGNAWLARTGMDEEKKNGCASGSFHAAATDAVKLTVPAVKQSSSRLWVNTFNVNIREHEAEQFEHERLYHVAEALAKELTTHPTMPQRLLESHEPEVAAQSGMWLGTSSCAFKGCMWQCDAMEFGDYQAREGADQARDGADHPWDQCLQKHICQAHGHIIESL